MDVQSFPVYFASLRDRNLSLPFSFICRSGKNGKEEVFLEISSIVPFEEMTVDDLLYVLVAGALIPVITHVVFYVFVGSCPDPYEKIESLRLALKQTGFTPHTFAWDFDDENGDTAILISIFSKKEVKYVRDIYLSRPL